MYIYIYREREIYIYQWGPQRHHHHRRRRGWLHLLHSRRSLQLLPAAEKATGTQGIYRGSPVIIRDHNYILYRVCVYIYIYVYTHTQIHEYDMINYMYVLYVLCIYIYMHKYTHRNDTDNISMAPAQARMTRAHREV